MEFRPCIDIHNGKVKQIVGSTLSDSGDYAGENFVSEKSGADFAALFRADGLMHRQCLRSENGPAVS